MFRVSNPKPCSCERKGSWIISMKGKTWQCNWHIFAGENNGLFLCFTDPVATVKPNHVLREPPTIGVRVKKQKKRMYVLTCKDFLTKIWAIPLCFWALDDEWRWRESTMMACTPWDQNGVCMLCVVHMVIFDHLAGLCLRSQHSLVSSVDAEYQSHSQRIRCEDMISPQRYPGWDFPFPAG